MNKQEFIKRWPNFTPKEFHCKCGTCGEDSGLLMKTETMDKLQALRTSCGFPFQITSGYRCPEHYEEKKKSTPGAHGHGKAIDLSIRGGQAMMIVSKAAEFEFTGVGVSQKGASRFIHLDDMVNEPVRPRPWIWSY